MEDKKIYNLNSKKLGKKESPADKFSRLSNIRVANLLDNLRLVGNLANKRFYEYSPSQKEEILKAIRKEYKLMNAAWDKAGNKVEPVKKKGFWDRVKKDK